MDGWLDRWMDGWMGGWINVDEETDRQTDRWDRYLDRYMYKVVMLCRMQSSAQLRAWEGLEFRFVVGVCLGMVGFYELPSTKQSRASLRMDIGPFMVSIS